MGNALPRIAVLGATGMIGAPVTRELVNAGFGVTAIVREPAAVSKSARLPAEVALVAGDVRDVASLVSAFRGHDIVYVSLATPLNQSASAWRVESEGMKNIVAAARDAGVSRIAYLSSLLHRYEGFQWWVFDMKREALATLKASSLPSTVFYASNFMESIPYRTRQGSRIALAGKAREKAYWISARDFGKQVVRALAIPGEASREFVVQGPEPLTLKEAAEEFVRNYTKEKLAVAGAPLALFKVLGLFSPTFDYVRHISEALNNLHEPLLAEATWRELGKPETTLAAFAKSFE